MVRSLIALQPIGYMRPRRPPVPKGITVQKASSSSFQLPAEIASATCGAYSAYLGSVSQVRMLVAAVEETFSADSASTSFDNASVPVMEINSGWVQVGGKTPSTINAER